MDEKINLAARLAMLERPYRPGIIGYLNDDKLQVVKAKGRPTDIEPLRWRLPSSWIYFAPCDTDPGNRRDWGSCRAHRRVYSRTTGAANLADSLGNDGGRTFRAQQTGQSPR